MKIGLGIGTTRIRRMVTAVAVSGISVAGTVVVAPAALASTAHAAPAVTSVSLNSGETKVTSSTKHKLRVELDSDQVPGSAAGSNVAITLGNGPLDDSETHTWTFPVSSKALKISSTGAGTLKVPSSNISPYGQVSLKITPTGKPKTENCNGTPTDLVQKVKLAGTFYFDSKSTGAHKWGTVGNKSAKKTFTFSSTNSVTWDYLTHDQEVQLCDAGANGSVELPCSSGLFWDDTVGDVDMSGFSLAGISEIDADRNVRLSTPTNATRDDNVSGTGPLPTLTTTPDPSSPDSSQASLAVTANHDASGAVTIASEDSTETVDIPCSGSTANQTVSASLWDSCSYTNGAIPLAVAAEVFGPISLANNAAATIIDLG